MEQFLGKLRKLQIQHAARQNELFEEIDKCTINTLEYFRLQRKWILAMRASTKTMLEISEIYERAKKVSSIYIK